MRKLFDPKEKIERWFLIDCSKIKTKIFGRLATKVATVLMGKDDEFYKISRDYVVLTNVNELLFSKSKEDVPKYFFHSRYLGSGKLKTPKEKGKIFSIISAVKGCLPKNRTQKFLISKYLKVFEAESNISQKFIDISNEVN